MRLATRITSVGFHWNDVPNEHNLLSFGSRPVLDFMCRPLDESSKEAREETFKPFHHLYDPDGKILVTKGPGGYFHAPSRPVLRFQQNHLRRQGGRCLALHEELLPIGGKGSR